MYFCDYEVHIAKDMKKQRSILQDDGSYDCTASRDTVHRYKMLMLQVLCLHDKLHPLRLCGIGVVGDGDCAQFGRARKKGYNAGHATNNKFWANIFLERGGRYRFDIFAHPGRG